ADEEIAALGQVDLHRVAVVREGDCSGVEAATEGAASITMTSYAPNELHYTYSSTEPVTAVFSEIYHPSWKATLDGKPIDLFRADWVLRAAELPAGSGEIVMRYEPRDYVVGEAVSRASSILLLLLLVGSVLFGVFARRK
ncbi:MAG: YfhO family protein, partial [Bacteroidales bacterium]|nr:YfhO family protein [Candidatus Equibacterium intestinale]